MNRSDPVPSPWAGIEHDHYCVYCGDPAPCPEWAHEETDEFACSHCETISEKDWYEAQFGGQRQ